MPSVREQPGGTRRAGSRSGPQERPCSRRATLTAFASSYSAALTASVAFAIAARSLVSSIGTPVGSKSSASFAYRSISSSLCLVVFSVVMVTDGGVGIGDGSAMAWMITASSLSVSSTPTSSQVTPLRARPMCIVKRSSRCRWMRLLRVAWSMSSSAIPCFRADSSISIRQDTLSRMVRQGVLSPRERVTHRADDDDERENPPANRAFLDSSEVADALSRADFPSRPGQQSPGRVASPPVCRSGPVGAPVCSVSLTGYAAPGVRCPVVQRSLANLSNGPPVVCSHCRQRPATTLDHDPPLAMHRHQERNAANCCRLIPSCEQCNRESGVMVALGTWRPGVTVAPDDEDARQDPPGHRR